VNGKDPKQFIVYHQHSRAPSNQPEDGFAWRFVPDDAGNCYIINKMSGFYLCAEPDKHHVAQREMRNGETRFLWKIEEVPVPPIPPPEHAVEYGGSAAWGFGDVKKKCPDTTAWRQRLRVRYRVSFYNEVGETPKGPWSRWIKLWSDTYLYAAPKLKIPLDPHETATGRRLYRQFEQKDEEYCRDIQNNTDTEVWDVKC
jgi:hypothetical protein